MKALVEAGRTPLEIRDMQGATPLYVAASTDQQQICLYLLSKKANVEVHLPPLQVMLTSLCVHNTTMIGHTFASGTSRAACTREFWRGSALQGYQDAVSWGEVLS